MQRQHSGKPRLTAEVVFFGREHGGRLHPPTFSPSHPYMPHIVVQDRSIRQAATVGNALMDAYKGVAFTEPPVNLQAGTSGVSGLVLMYYPEVDYADVQPGTTITIREGGKVVGHGVVLTRADPAAA